MATEEETLATVVKQCHTDACISGLSWSGFNIVGDRKSIDRVKAALHSESIIPALRSRLVEATRDAAALSRDLDEARAERDRARQQVSDMSWTPGTYQNGL